MKTPILSVIVPVYNAADRIENCVHSILTQAPAETQLVLVDDGSTDGSSGICDQLAKEDGRIEVIHQPNGGASAARNRGLAEVRGRYLEFVDADDELVPGLYERALPILEEGGDVFVFNAANQSGRPGDLLPEGWFDRPMDLPSRPDYYLVDSGVFAALYNKIYRTEAVRDLRFDPELQVNEDLLFSLQALRRCKRAYFEPQSFYLYNDLQEGSLSRRLRTDLLEAEEATRADFTAFLIHFGLSESEAEALLHRRQAHVAVSQCALILGRTGRIRIRVMRRVFAKALGPRHQREAVADWVRDTYSPLPRTLLLFCVRLRMAELLALLCALKNRLRSR